MSYKSLQRAKVGERLAGKSLSKKISDLLFCMDVENVNLLALIFLSNQVILSFIMLCAFMKLRILY